MRCPTCKRVHYIHRVPRGEAEPAGLHVTLVHEDLAWWARPRRERAGDRELWLLLDQDRTGDLDRQGEPGGSRAGDWTPRSSSASAARPERW